MTMEMVIRYGDKEYTVAAFAELMKQLGRCDCGRHGELQNRRLRFAGQDKDQVNPVCNACGKPINARGEATHTPVRWETVLPFDLSVMRPGETPPGETCKGGQDNGEALLALIRRLVEHCGEDPFAGGWCFFCSEWAIHTSECPWVEARKIIGQHKGEQHDV